MKTNEIDKNNNPEKIEEIFEFEISKGFKPVRLDHFLTNHIHNATRTKVQKSIDLEGVTLNGKFAKASKKIQPGDKIVCKILKLPPIELVPEDIPLDIIFEDEYLLVVNKPAGMVTHPGLGNRYGTLVNALIFHLGQRESIQIEVDDEDGTVTEGKIFASEDVRPGIIHRLDKDTTGLLVIAKKPEIHTMISDQFLDRTISREYKAIVWGFPDPADGIYEGDIGRSPRFRTQYAVVRKGGKHAITDYWTEAKYKFTSLMRIKLRTGRTHQIRVHFTANNHPLFGDETYGGTNIIYGAGSPSKRNLAQKAMKIAKRQMLHAAKLSFIHPISKERVSFEAPLPDDMKQVIDLFKDIEEDK